MIVAGWCTLRPWAPPDVAFVFDACQDPDIQRWTMVPRPYRPGDAVEFVRRHARPQPEPEGAWFAITSTDTGEALGSISLHRIDPVTGRGELGYWVAAEARGRGVATVALGALAAWSGPALGLAEVEVVVAAANTVSRRVAARAGFLPASLIEGGCHNGDAVDDGIVLVRPTG